MTVAGRGRAFTVPELLIAAVLFVLLTVLLALALQQATRLWLFNSSHLDGSRQLRLASTRFEDELSMARLEKVAVGQVPSTLNSAAFDGDAIWFLSHINPHDGKAYLKTNGTPFWQCNILYYCITPSDVSMPTGRDADGYEDRCYRKMLVRKVIDLNGPSDPKNEATQEQLIPADDLKLYLTVPDGKGNTGGERGEVLKTEIIATRLLYFKATTDPIHNNVVLDMRALSEDEAGKAAGGLDRNLLDSPYTLQNLLSVQAKN